MKQPQVEYKPAPLPVPSPKPEPVVQVSVAAPLARRCYVRADVLKSAVENIMAKLETYQLPEAARDLDPTVEVSLRISLETITRLVEALNSPPAYMPHRG